jgi:hypothetical protein
MIDDLVKRLCDEGHLQQRDTYSALLQTCFEAALCIKKLEATLTDIISEYDEPDNGRSLRWAVDIGRDVLKGYKDE